MSRRKNTSMKHGAGYKELARCVIRLAVKDAYGENKIKPRNSKSDCYTPSWARSDAMRFLNNSSRTHELFFTMAEINDGVNI